MFSTTVRAGNRLNTWKTKPNASLRKRALAAGSSREISSPSTSHVPPSGSSRVAMTEISDVLPQPDGPTIIVSSPRRTSRSRPLNAATWLGALP